MVLLPIGEKSPKSFFRRYCFIGNKSKQKNRTLSGFSCNHELRADLIEHYSKSALSSCSGVLVHDILCNSLIDLLDRILIGSRCKSLIACFNSSLKLLHRGLESCLDHFVLHGLGSGYKYALLC